MFEYRESSVVSKRSQARVDIIDTIHCNVEKVEDVQGYADLFLLINDSKDGAEYYGMNKDEYSQLVSECVSEVVKANS